MDITDIAAQIETTGAQLAVAKIMRILGRVEDWAPDQLDYIAETLMDLRPEGIPSFVDQDEAAIEFWQNAADEVC
ncbi:hypothetical protein [Gordonia sp. GAMMA]|uniref:hypothetical protein n=1 Tax=Gordonia sp. GAMMA TaxID=2502241 RepID=UPI0010F74FF5|nr:hypothetical protein [Gordonia sp. GAMMA]